MKKIITIDGSVGDYSGEFIDRDIDVVFGTFERSRSDRSVYVGEECYLRSEVTLLDTTTLKGVKTS